MCSQCLFRPYRQALFSRESNRLRSLTFENRDNFFGCLQNLGYVLELTYLWFGGIALFLDRGLGVLDLSIKLFDVVPICQLLLFGVVGRIATLESILRAFEPRDLSLGVGDLLQIIAHGAADELVAERIERGADIVVVLHGVGDGVYPAVDYTGEANFKQRLEIGQGVRPPGSDD